MALKKYIVDLMRDNPLNGISTYNDVLTLSTGVIIRKIKKLVLTGEEDITSTHTDVGLFNIPITDYLKIANVATNICTHYLAGTNVGGWADVTDRTSRFYANPASTAKLLYIRDSSYTTVADFKSYLATQYANGTPVTVWYVLANETTEYITAPTGLSGTVDGYTTQTGTPTPTNPIYPTVNTVTMWANYTPPRYNGNAFVTATGQPEQYNGGWS